MRINSSNYFESLEAGDTVVMRLHTGEHRLYPVCNVQSRFFFVENSKYRKTDGSKVSSDHSSKWYPTQIVDAPSQELIDELKCRQLAEQIRNATFSPKVTLDQLARVKAIFDETELWISHD